MRSKSKNLFVFLCWTNRNIFVYLVHVGGDDLCAVRYNHDVIYITCIRSYVFGLKKFYVSVFIKFYKYFGRCTRN